MVEYLPPQKKKIASLELLDPWSLEYMYPSPGAQAEFSSEIHPGRRLGGVHR